MDSNEHGTLEQNEEHHETNISIYYTHKTELYAESYDAMKYATECKNHGTWRKIRGGRGQPSRSGSGAVRRWRRELAGVSSGEGGEASEREEEGAGDGGLGGAATGAGDAR